MNQQTLDLKGSPKRDVFKWAHKNKIKAPFYASDCDLCIVSFKPRGVIAYIDYKGSGEGVTPTEAILYDEWSKTNTVYIVEGSDPENGPFAVSRYVPGSTHTEPVCILKDWSDFTKWEAELRRRYSKQDERDEQMNRRPEVGF